MVHVFSTLKATSSDKQHQGHACKACPNNSTNWGPIIQMLVTLRSILFIPAPIASKYWSESHWGVAIRGKWWTPVSAEPTPIQSMLNRHSSCLKVCKNMQKTHNQTLSDSLPLTLWGKRATMSSLYNFRHHFWKSCWDRSLQDFFLKFLRIK